MRSTFLATALLFSLGVHAQIAHGGKPYGWPAAAELPEPGAIALSALDNATLQAQDEDEYPGQYRYGVQRFMNVDVLAQGTWSTLPDDRRVCRIGITSPGAVAMSVLFDRFELAPEARVYLYDADRTTFLGGFTAANHQPTGDLPTALVRGASIVIEYEEPVGATGSSVLHVLSITHAYRDVFSAGVGASRDYDPGYQSAPCHNNVACGVASAWQTQASSVAMFLRPDGNGCSGSLVNNTAQNGTPYFYCANHCYTPTTSQWVFYFNYKSPGCVGSSGPTTDVLTGATLRANDYFDDFVLLELFNTPPANYNVAYSGWDRSGSNPTQQTVIHHPLYDVKKITFDLNPATSLQVTPYVGAPFDTYLWRNYWDNGIVEAVSSGAPLFDQNKRIIGHMYDGAQNCGNAGSVPTDCAKFSYSWNGSAPSNRLRDWLDPANTTMTLNAYVPSGQSPPILVQLVAFLQGPYDGTSGLMAGTLRSNGLVPLQEPYSALGYTHVGGGGETTTAGVLATTGSTSVVDWVVVELRNKNLSSQVLATQSALLLRNGSIVSTNGTSPLAFTLPADDYYIAVRHRNHLGIMTQNPRALGVTASTTNLGTTVPLHGGSGATAVVNGVKCMWAGNALRDDRVKYTGAQNDRDAVLSSVGGTVPTNVQSGYLTQDLNMDGVVKYSGAQNDRDLILQTLGGVDVTTTRIEPLP